LIGSGNLQHLAAARALGAFADLVVLGHQPFAAGTLNFDRHRECPPVVKRPSK
jgi:hypothetical protein